MSFSSAQPAPALAASGIRQEAWEGSAVDDLYRDNADDAKCDGSDVDGLDANDNNNGDSAVDDADYEYQNGDKEVDTESSTEFEEVTRDGKAKARVAGPKLKTSFAKCDPLTRLVFNVDNKIGADGLRPVDRALLLAKERIKDPTLLREVQIAIRDCHATRVTGNYRSFGGHPAIRRIKDKLRKAVIARGKGKTWSSYLPSHADVLATYLLEPNGASPPAIDGFLRHLGREDLASPQFATGAAVAQSNHVTLATRAVDGISAALDKAVGEAADRFTKVENVIGQMHNQTKADVSTLTSRLEEVDTKVNESATARDKAATEQANTIATIQAQVNMLQKTVDQLNRQAVIAGLSRDITPRASKHKPSRAVQCDADDSNRDPPPPKRSRNGSPTAPASSSKRARTSRATAIADSTSAKGAQDEIDELLEEFRSTRSRRLTPCD